ncbi:MAG: flagellar hook protein FlgE [Bacillota bacterium]|nr:flagellar hook protein FlgE [Bacillota bacterium]
MMRSLFSAVSGLKTHQQRMDVIGNNIANVNTPGFKRSRVTFQDMLNQTIRGASRPVEGGRGGTNPIQIGLGVTTGSIDTIMTSTSLQETGKMTDLGIDGEGFFILAEKEGGREFYTRVGSFDFDSNGNLVSNLNGMHVLGWLADTTGKINSEQDPVILKINLNETEPAKPTENIVFAGNLDSRLTSDKVTVRQTVYDSLGNTYTAVIEFTNTGGGDWTCKLIDMLNSAGNSIDPPGTFQGEGTVSFNDEGKWQSYSETNPFKFDPDGTGYLAEVNITLDFSKMTQYAAETTATVQSQDGYSSGVLESLTIDQTGAIVGVFSNGTSRVLAQVALRRFTNPAGLLKAGNSLFTESSNSGRIKPAPPGTSGYGTVKPGSLEMSNVDLSSEFTDLIVTQRGFQANSRVITASDEMLQELVNLKR